MNLRHKIFDTEIYEELEQKKLKGMVCFEKDIKESVEKFEKIFSENMFTNSQIEKEIDLEQVEIMETHNNDNLNIIKQIREIFGVFNKIKP